jgi:glycosyltransferase involved in cell wall biosynthesis
MLFDLSINGHHPAYITHLIRYWCENQLSGYLDIVVSPKFIQHHYDVVEIASNYDVSNVNFVAIDSEAEAALKSRKSGVNRTARAFQEWDLLCHYAGSLKATQCLIMYFDTCQIPLVFGKKPCCPVSGIYFRPTFHYSNFAHFVPSWQDRLQQWREKLLLSRVLQHPQLQTLFCLDPFVVQHIDQFHSSVNFVPLPDPVPLTTVSETQVISLRERLGIDPDKQVFILFGALTGRKGIDQLLEAVAMLPPELSQKFCLVLAGQANPQEQSRMATHISDICQASPVQIITNYEFIPEPEVQTYFQLADVVLAPYQRHVGMSGILLLAAAAQKPVLSSDYGLMGEMVQRYSLGLTVDSTIPAEIARGLTRFLLEPPTELCDRTSMKSFAEQNSAEQFASVIFQYVLL